MTFHSMVIAEERNSIPASAFDTAMELTGMHVAFEWLTERVSWNTFRFQVTDTASESIGMYVAFEWLNSKRVNWNASRIRVTDTGAT